MTPVARPLHAARVTQPRSDLGTARDHRRTDLIAAARERFAARGYHDTTVDDITRAAGVAKGTFYLYFAEKREVYHEVIRGFMQLIHDTGATVAAKGERAEKEGGAEAKS